MAVKIEVLEKTVATMQEKEDVGVRTAALRQCETSTKVLLLNSASVSYHSSPHADAIGGLGSSWVHLRARIPLRPSFVVTTSCVCHAQYLI